MKHKFLLPLATLTLLSGCGGSTTANLDELVNDLTNGNVGQAFLNDLAEKENAKEKLAILEIDAIGSAGKLIGAVTDVLNPEEGFDITVGQTARLPADPDEPDEPDQVVLKLSGTDEEFGGEQIFVLMDETTDGDAQIVVLSDSADVFSRVQNSVDGVLDLAFSSAEKVLQSADVNSEVSFKITDEAKYGNPDLEGNVLQQNYELQVYDGENEVISVSKQKFKILNSSDAFMSSRDGHFVVLSAGSARGFSAPSGTQTYNGTIVLGNDEDTTSVFGNDLKIAVDFVSSTGTLAATGLTGINDSSDSGSLAGQFTVINATGSFSGTAVSTLNGESDQGRLIGSFDPAANLLGGIVSGKELSGLFAAEKN